MPATMPDHVGSGCRMVSRSGIDATTIQSTSASRPRRPAASWLTTVENVLLISPSQIAARHLGLIKHLATLPSGSERRQIIGSMSQLHCLYRSALRSATVLHERHGT